jgi:hypothetical protein
MEMIPQFYKTEINGRGDFFFLLFVKWALTLPTSGGHSVGIVRFAD